MKKILSVLFCGFALLSYSQNQFWNLNGTAIYTTYNVGINTQTAQEPLTVNGNILATGSISAASLNVVDVVSSEREFKISTAVCLKGFDPDIPGSRNEICGLNGDLFIQSMNNNYNTIFNYGNTGKVGIGLVPVEAFHVGVKARFNEDVYTTRIYTSRITTEDSLIHIGDSSIILNPSANFITNSSSFWNSTLIRGISIAPSTNGSVTSTATGAGALSLGNYLRTNGTGAVTLGRGVNNSSPLANNDNFTFKVGFNSDKATLTVTNSGGAGTTGSVGIGTETPGAKLTVHAEADPQVGGYGILSTTNVPTVKSISVIHKDSSQNIDDENFIVYANGKVYCREVFVKLGVLGDFVFDEDYELMNYHELAAYLKKNKHLPGVPSEPEVLSGGLNVGEMQAKVLQKTEENTLYILDLNKRLEASENENEKLKAQLEEMQRKQAGMEEKMNELIGKK